MKKAIEILILALSIGVLGVVTSAFFYDFLGGSLEFYAILYSTSIICSLLHMYHQEK